MKITFYSCFLTHHQVPFCLEMQKKFGDDFKFVSATKITEERLKLGYKDMDKDYDFVVRAYENEEEYQRALNLAVDSDIVIMGSTSDIYIKKRLELDKLTFRYRERIFKSNMVKTFLNKEQRNNIKQRHLKCRKNKNLYMLCASAYGPNDFYFLNLYKDKIYKWGYFPKTEIYDVDKLIEEKENNEVPLILWAGRFIEWKHPDYMVKLAKRLKNDGYKFKIKMLGDGVLHSKVKAMAIKEGVNDQIEMNGSVPSEEVKTYMEKANIFVATSDRNEGWGVVINESMNAACTVVADRNIGSVPFLIENEKNGLMYDNFEELYSNVKKALDNKELRAKLGKNAYKTLTQEWTAEIAVNNLVELFTAIYNGKKPSVEKGPASKAEPYYYKK